MAIKKDKKLKRILNSRKMYLLLLIPLIFYRYLDRMILNEPKHFLFIKFFIAIVVIISIIISRYKKFKDYYSNLVKNANWIEYVLYFGGFCITAMLFQAFISIPLYLILIQQSQKNEIEYFNCEITNITTTGFDKIYFDFKGSNCVGDFNAKNNSREDLLKNYYLEVGAKKSFGNTYVLTGLELRLKQ